MDLGAYANIEDIKAIAEANNIEIPRLRGYRLMGKESPIPEASVAENLKEVINNVYDQGVRTCPSFNFNTGWSEYSYRTDLVADKYLIREPVTYKVDDEEYTHIETVGFRWNLLHGKKRKNLKFEIKKQKKAYFKNIEAFNRYAGRDDVLYIHARIGGNNWECFGGPELEKQPWFLEKVDDLWDDTYCDIYAKINPVSK